MFIMLYCFQIFFESPFGSWLKWKLNSKFWDVEGIVFFIQIQSLFSNEFSLISSHCVIFFKGHVLQSRASFENLFSFKVNIYTWIKCVFNIFEDIFVMASIGVFEIFSTFPHNSVEFYLRNFQRIHDSHSFWKNKKKTSTKFFFKILIEANKNYVLWFVSKKIWPYRSSQF